MVRKFRKKPVVIAAIQYLGTKESLDAVRAAFPDLQTMPTRDGHLLIPTLEGDMFAAPRDWIIQGVKGEHYPCKPDIFEATYEAVAESLEGPVPSIEPDATHPWRP